MIGKLILINLKTNNVIKIYDIHTGKLGYS